MTTEVLTAPDGHAFDAYVAEPAGTPSAAVVVVQEIFGVNDHIRSVADRFAAAGFLAAAPALFDRIQRGVELDYDAAGTEAGRELAWGAPIDHPITDLVATADHLAVRVAGAGRVATVGFCYGGMLSAAVACRAPRSIGAAVAYYPSMAAELLVADQPHVPLLVHLGDTDTRVTPEDGRRLEARWPDATFHRYPAGHGFNCDRRADFDRASSDLAFARTIDFLHRTVGDGA
ncbi:MAG: dienelactone hydrolase family protein [Acidimicrobiales bacterium]